MSISRSKAFISSALVGAALAGALAGHLLRPPVQRGHGLQLEVKHQVSDSELLPALQGRLEELLQSDREPDWTGNPLVRSIGLVTRRDEAATESHTNVIGTSLSIAFAFKIVFPSVFNAASIMQLLH